MQFDKESPPDLSNLGSSHFSINFPPFAILVISHPDEAATLPKASKGTISPPTHSFFCYFHSNQRLHTFHIWHRVLWCLWGTKVTHNPDVEMPSTFFCHDFFLEHFQFQSLIPIRGGGLPTPKSPAGHLFRETAPQSVGREEGGKDGKTQMEEELCDINSQLNTLGLESTPCTSWTRPMLIAQLYPKEDICTIFDMRIQKRNTDIKKEGLFDQLIPAAE